MNIVNEELVETLRTARRAKGLSQRALSQLAGVPQSHISRIENNSVDLRTSSLIAIARALGLELTLVPRRALPAVRSIIHRVADPSSPAQPAYQLDEGDNDA